MHSYQKKEYELKEYLQSLDSKVDKIIEHLHILVDKGIQATTTAMGNGSLQVINKVVMDATG
jgi:hypothetical protein